MTFIYLIGILVFLGIMVSILYSINQPDIISQAKTLINTNHTNEAIELLEQEIKKDYQNSNAYYHLGLAYEKIKNPEKSLHNFLEVKTLSKYNKEIDIKIVFKKIANSYNQLEQVDNSFEAYLNLLSIDENDIEGNFQIGFWLIGNNKLKESIPYLEKCHEDEDLKKSVLMALSIAYYETENYSKAYDSIKILEQDDPYDEDIMLIFTIISHKTALEESKDKLEMLMSITEDENTLLILIRIYFYVSYKLSFFEDGYKHIEKAIRSKELTTDIKDEIQYYILLLVLRVENYQKAQKILDTMNESKFDVKSLKYFLNSMSIKMKTNEGQTFEDIIERILSNIVPDSLLYSISGLQKEELIQFEKYFDLAYDPNRLKTQYQPLTKKTFLKQFIQLSLPEFIDFSEKVIELEDCQSPHQLGDTDSEELNFTAYLSNNKENILFSFRRLKENTPLSEIVLENLINLMEDEKCKQLKILSNSEPSEEVQNKLKEYTAIQLYSTNKMIEYFQIWKFWGQAIAEKKDLQDIE